VDDDGIVAIGQRVTGHSGWTARCVVLQVDQRYVSPGSAIGPSLNQLDLMWSLCDHDVDLCVAQFARGHLED
jgi:hypothetical protein